MRQTILFVSNDPRHPSGVGGQVKHICRALWNTGKYEACVIALTNKTPVDPPVRFTWPSGEEVTIYSSNLQNEAFGDAGLVSECMLTHKPACLVLFDDPRRFVPLLDHAAFIRSRIPIYGIQVWDTWLVPTEDSPTPHFNLPIYENFDAIGCISHQTEWFIRKVFEKSEFTPAPAISYVGHGSDPDTFKPLPLEELTPLRKTIFGDNPSDFVVLAVNQNQGRKKLPDLIEAWRIFFRGLPSDAQRGAHLILKTSISHPVGTNLDEVIQALAPGCNIRVIPAFMPDTELAKIYNLADVHVNCANAEGFGLSQNEAMLCGIPTITNAVGGLVDQMGYVNQMETNPIWVPEDLSGFTFGACGSWCYPVHGRRTIIGAPQTPYLYDFNPSIEDIVDGLKYWHGTPKALRRHNGLQGRQWCLDRGLTSDAFASNVIRDLESTIANFKPRPLAHLYAA